MAHQQAHAHEWLKLLKITTIKKNNDTGKAIQSLRLKSTGGEACQVVMSKKGQINLEKSQIAPKKAKYMMITQRHL